MPQGTRQLLKDIHAQIGLSKEDVFKLGFRYVAAKQAHDAKKADTLTQKAAKALGIAKFFPIKHRANGSNPNPELN